MQAATTGRSMIGRHPALTLFSLASILLASFHIADDVARGFEPGGLKHIQTILTLSLWLSGAVVLAGRRAGYVVMLLGAILGMLISVAHMRGAGVVGGRIAGSSGTFFWVWTILALGITSVVSFVLAATAMFGRTDPLDRTEPGTDS